MAGYPNLLFIEENFYNNIRDRHHEIRRWECNFVVEVFLQEFPRATGIFEYDGVFGQSFIRQYITVIRETNHDIWGVYSGNYYAYMIENPNEIMKIDLNNRDMATSKYAHKRYKNENSSD